MGEAKSSLSCSQKRPRQAVRVVLLDQVPLDSVDVHPFRHSLVGLGYSALKRSTSPGAVPERPGFESRWRNFRLWTLADLKHL